MSEQLEVDAGDAVRLILQFLKENRLFHALRALQEESQISLSAVDSADALAGDIAAGRWDAVLQQTTALEASTAAMAALYEHVALEMLEAREVDVALQLLRATPPLAHLKQREPERCVRARAGVWVCVSGGGGGLSVYGSRYLRLEKLAQKAVFDPVDAYAGSSKQKRRDDIAELFKSEVRRGGAVALGWMQCGLTACGRQVTSVAPSRLLSLLGQALKWQQMQVGGGGDDPMGDAAAGSRQLTDWDARALVARGS